MATIRVPVDAVYSGKMIVVNYSDDWVTWSILGNYMAKKDVNGLIYVEFTTNHFTDFALGEGTCSFVINNDDTHVQPPPVQHGMCV
jgi:hypothetical protein